MSNLIHGDGKKGGGGLVTVINERRYIWNLLPYSLRLGFWCNRWCTDGLTWLLNSLFCDSRGFGVSWRVKLSEVVRVWCVLTVVGKLVISHSFPFSLFVRSKQLCNYKWLFIHKNIFSIKNGVHFNGYGLIFSIMSSMDLLGGFGFLYTLRDWIFWTGFWLCVWNMQELPYLRIFNGIFILFINLYCFNLQSNKFLELSTIILCR